jgi:hypothetical protein
VSFNAANGNGDDGIDVGADGDFDGSRSLVTGNTADDNGDVGIEAQCPSTVTFNKRVGQRPELHPPRDAALRRPQQHINPRLGHRGRGHGCRRGLERDELLDRFVQRLRERSRRVIAI